ncbi:MAG: flagellar assembly protein FliH [Gammaproteobacteria bacterium]|nr:flagellar assembly protein FliH [Gammaproteobacteria bacterium]
MTSRVIPRDAAHGFECWDLPIVEDVSAAVKDARHGKAPGLMTAEQIERIQKQAYKEAYDAGFQKGRQEGMASGKAEIATKEKLLTTMLDSLSHPLDRLDEAVEQQLVSLALSIARQLVRRELKADPGQVVGVVREALAVLPIGSQDVKVCLHPDDVLLMRESIAQSGADQNWSLVEDPSLMRGDCRILTRVSQIEATLEKRLTAVVAPLLADARGRDATPAAPADDE